MRLLISIVVLGVALLSLGSLFWLSEPVHQAGLKWQNSQLKYAVKSGQDSVLCAFGFTNDSHKPVEIKSVEPDCSCLVTKLPKTVYAPGESGEIETKFTVGSRYGKVKRVLQVLTDASAQPAQLHLVFDIPELLNVSPRILFWQKGAQNGSQDVEIAMINEPYRILRVAVVNRVFKADVEEVSNANKYEIHVQPIDTKVARSSEMIIQTDCPYAPWNHIVCQLRIQ